MLSATDIGYLAGILDGEGSVLLYRNTADDVARLVIQASTSTSPLITGKVQDILASLGIEFGVVFTKPNPVKGFRGSWAVQIRRAESQRRFMGSVGFAVVAKAEQLGLAKTFLFSRSGKGRKRTAEQRSQDDLLITRMRELNGRGLNSVTTAREPAEMPMIQSELHGDMQSAAEMTAPEKIQ